MGFIDEKKNDNWDHYKNCVFVSNGMICRHCDEFIIYIFNKLRHERDGHLFQIQKVYQKIKYEHFATTNIFDRYRNQILCKPNATIMNHNDYYDDE